MLRAIQPWGELEDLRKFGGFVDVAVGGNRLLAKLIERCAGLPATYIPTGTRRGTPRNSEEPVARAVRLAYIGRLDSGDKRVLDLIDVVQRLTIDYTLTIAGDGPARAQLEATLNANFLGDVPVDRLYDEVYPNLDAILIFSTAEAGPQVAFQAMHFGVVPISSRYLGLKSEGLLRDGETALLFDVGDTATAAKQVERLAREPELRARIAANAQRAVEPRYILDHSLGEYVNAFNDAVTKPPAIGTALPPLTPSGLFERLHMPWLRRFRTHDAIEAGGEWPHHHGIDAATKERLVRLAQELDA